MSRSGALFSRFCFFGFETRLASWPVAPEARAVVACCTVVFTKLSNCCLLRALSPAGAGAGGIDVVAAGFGEVTGGLDSNKMNAIIAAIATEATATTSRIRRELLRLTCASCSEMREEPVPSLSPPVVLGPVVEGAGVILVAAVAFWSTAASKTSTIAEHEL